jgi:nitric oxide reductase large subunit
LIVLLGGIGLLLAAFGRWNLLDWHGRERDRVPFRAPDEVALTPSQRACAWFFLVMIALFLLRALLGGASEHYRADISNFFGIDLATVIPFNIARTWHLQLAIFWVATIPAFYGVGLLAHPASHFTSTDFWRFWVDFLELFTTIMVAYIFVLLGVAIHYLHRFRRKRSTKAQLASATINAKNNGIVCGTKPHRMRQFLPH